MGTTETQGQRLGYRPELDGLRAIAILLVLAHHADMPGLRGGWAGVDLFFVLSGFLITTLLLEEHQAHGRIDLRAFYLRRARRLIPALIPVLVAVAVYALAVEPDPAMKTGLLASVVATATYWMNWLTVIADFGGEPLGHAWSLAVEEQFYLLWPLAMLALPRRMVGWAAAAGAAAAVAVRIQLSGQGVTWQELYSRTDTRADALLIGCVVAVAFTTRERWLPHVRRQVAAAGILAAVGFGAAALLLPTESTGLYRFGLSFLAAAAGTMILALVTVEPARTTRALASGPLVYVGRRSYALYLWHWPILWAVERHTSGGWWVAAGVALAFAAAEASWLLVEARWVAGRDTEASGERRSDRDAVPRREVGLDRVDVGGREHVVVDQQCATVP